MRTTSMIWMIFGKISCGGRGQCLDGEHMKNGGTEND